MNIALAVAAALAFHIVGHLPATIAPWLAANLRNGLIINVVLAVFNLFPLHLSTAGAFWSGFFQRRLLRLSPGWSPTA